MIFSSIWQVTLDYTQCFSVHDLFRDRILRTFGIGNGHWTRSLSTCHRHCHGAAKPQLELGLTCDIAAHGHAACAEQGRACRAARSSVTSWFVRVSQHVCSIGETKSTTCSHCGAPFLLASHFPLLSLVREPLVLAKLLDLPHAECLPGPRVNSNGIGEVHDGPRVAAVHNAKHVHARGQRLDDFGEDVVVENDAGLPVVDWDERLIESR